MAVLHAKASLEQLQLPVFNYNYSQVGLEQGELTGLASCQAVEDVL